MIDLQLGGSTRQVRAADALTDAERVAFNQVLSTGQQLLQLGALGNAVGGSFRADSDLRGTVAGLVIPQGVTAIHDFGSGSPLSILGNLTNAGSLFAVTSNPAVANATISAGNIFNQQGALLTSVLPAGGLAGFSNLSQHLNLTVYALNNIINAGTISSSGNLTAIAGGAIINSLPAGASGVSPVMQALNNLNLQAASILNAGVLASVTSNINLLSATRLSDVVLNNLSGRLEALSGTINVRDGLYVGSGNTIFSGGDLLSRELNIYSGCGGVNVDVGQILGEVNISAREAHVSSSTSVLRLGSMSLSGDPTFYNTAGDVYIGSPLVFAGAPLSIVASGNIVGLAGAGAIDTGSVAGNGGNILMIAGASFTSSGGAAASNDSTSILTVTGASATGGAIDLASLGAITALQSRSTAANGSGGNITLAAFPGSGAGSGSIILPTGVAIASGGSGNGANGNVAVFGGAAGGAALSTGAIDTRGGAAGTGNITVTTSLPSLASGNLLVAGGGAIISGAIAPGTLTPGRINTGALSADGAAITVAALGPVLVGGSIVSDGSSTHDGGIVKILTFSPLPFIIDPTMEEAGSGVVGTISASGGPTSGAGGTIQIINAGAGGITLPATASLNVAPSQGAGGDLELLSLGGPVEGPVNLPSGTLSVDAAGSGNFNGGKLFIAGSDILINGGGHLALSANAVGSGDGGLFGLGTSGTASDLSVGTGAGQISLSASGGSSLSPAGHGGLVAIAAGRDLSVDPAALAAAPLGANGDGANILMGAGMSGVGNLQLLNNALLTSGVTASSLENLALVGSGNIYVSGNLSANGVGLGNGGNILLGCKSPLALSVGTATALNGVHGLITALPGNSLRAGGTVSLLNVGAGGVDSTASANISTGPGATTNSANGVLVVTSAQSSLLSSFALQLSASINRLITFASTPAINSAANVRPAVSVKLSGPNRLSTTSVRIPGLVSRLSNNMDTAAVREMETSEEPEVNQVLTGTVLFQADEEDGVNELPEAAEQLEKDSELAVCHNYSRPGVSPASNSRILAQEGSRFIQTSPANIHLSRGTIFARLGQDTELTAGLARVEARRGALLSLESGEGHLRVKALSGPGDVFVHTAGHKIALHPGQEILITRNRPDRSEMFPLDGVGRRQVQTHVLTAHRSATLSEFSIISFMRECPALSGFKLASGNADRQLKEQLLKVAAAVQLVTARHGRYYTPRAETGYVPSEAMKLPEAKEAAQQGSKPLTSFAGVIAGVNLASKKKTPASRLDVMASSGIPTVSRQGQVTEEGK